MGKLTKNTIYRYILWILYYGLIFFIFFHSSFNALDPDLGWHLQVGAEISRTQEVPRLNLYNYSLSGNWVDHEWLGDLVLYKIYAAAGYTALVVLFSLLGLAIFAFLHWEINRRFPGLHSGYIIFFQLVGLLAIMPHIGVRLQLFGLLFVVLLLSLLAGLERRAAWRYLLILPVMFYVWACLHASFLLGIFIIFAWLFIRGAESLISYLKPLLSISQVSFRLQVWLKLLAAALASLAATFFTPYHWELYGFLSGYRDNFYQTKILEWLPQYYFPLQYLQIFYLALVVAITILYAKEKPRQRPWDYWSVFLLVLLFVMSWQARRHFPLFVVATMPFVVYCSQEIIKRIGLASRISFLPGHKALVALCLVIVNLVLFFSAKISNDPFLAHCSHYPCQATEFLRTRPDLDALRLFNHYGWGGYLIWQLPARQLFIDGRLPQAEFSGQTFLEEYYEFFKNTSSAQAKLDQHAIDLVLLPKQDEASSFNRLEKFIFRGLVNDQTAPDNHLRQYLVEAGWQTIYQDQTAIIYMRP